jgi:hypothetical protein
MGKTRVLPGTSSLGDVSSTGVAITIANMERTTQMEGRKKNKAAELGTFTSTALDCLLATLAVFLVIPLPGGLGPARGVPGRPNAAADLERKRKADLRRKNRKAAAAEKRAQKQGQV